MAIEIEKTTKQIIKAVVGNAMVKVYVTDGNPERVTIAWPRTTASASGWWEHEIEGCPEVLPDLYKAIGEAMEYIQLAKV